MHTPSLPAHTWARRPRPPRHSPPRVLLAEDDPDMRDLVASVLRRASYSVTEAADGGRLLVALTGCYGNGEDHESYDLLISDIRMPICSGLQIVSSLRKARWSMPVILMTAFGDEATRAQAEGLGALLLDKPLDIDDLLAAARLLNPSVHPAAPLRDSAGI